MLAKGIRMALDMMDILPAPPSSQSIDLDKNLIKKQQRSDATSELSTHLERALSLSRLYQLRVDSSITVTLYAEWLLTWT